MMDLAEAMQHVAATRNGVLVTHRRDGRAQLSNIVHVVGDDGLIRISITDTRAKTKNLRRDPRCELYVAGDNFWRFLVLDAECELSAVAARPDDDAVEELVGIYRALRGEHPNWDEYRQAMVNDRRLVARLTPSRAYGLWMET
jgi:PPOX class probable F420-dependent enzyme